MFPDLAHYTSCILHSFRRNIVQPYVTFVNTVQAHFNTREAPRPAVSRSSVHIHLGMPIPCLRRPFGAPLTVSSTQSSHDKHLFNLNSCGNIDPKPVNQRAQDALDLPETSPFRRILQGAVKGADFDPRSSLHKARTRSGPMCVEDIVLRIRHGGQGMTGQRNCRGRDGAR